MRPSSKQKPKGSRESDISELTWPWLDPLKCVPIRLVLGPSEAHALPLHLLYLASSLALKSCVSCLNVCVELQEMTTLSLWDSSADRAASEPLGVSGRSSSGLVTLRHQLLGVGRLCSSCGSGPLSAT